MAAPPRVVAMLVSGGLEHAGGIGRWAGYLLGAWAELGPRPGITIPPIEIIDTRGHGGLLVAARSFASALRRLVALRSAGRLGVIHANLAARGSTVRKCIVGLLARGLGATLVLHLHGSDYDAFYDGLPGWAQRRVRRLFAQAAMVIVLGEAWAEWAVQTAGVPRSRIMVLYNGVSRPAPRGIPSPDRAREGCHIVMLGRIGQRKGVPELLDALGSAALRDRAWRATLAGDGEVAAYAQAAAERGLAGRVAFPGWLDGAAAARLLADADILVLASHAENLPISVIEGLAHQIAVVTTPVGATPELLAHGRSALFVPVGDAAALAAALASLIDDPVRRAAIAAAGHVVFVEKLAIDTLAERLATMHAGLLDPRPQTS